MQKSNKRIGGDFEKYLCKELARQGWWAHFLSPGPGGAQPFDVLAIRGSSVMAIDCKTCKSRWFSYSRIETNQRLAFDMLMEKSDKRKVKCGFSILHDDKIIFLPYERVLADEKHGRRSYDLEER